MRSYPRNSPQAAARILALVMLADGHPCHSEMALLDRLEAHAQLGLSRPELHAVVHAFCEDLMVFSTGICWSDLGLVRPDALGQILGEVTDPELQRTVMGLCIGLVQADRHLAQKESVLLTAAMLHWGLPGQALPEALHGAPA